LEPYLDIVYTIPLQYPDWAFEVSDTAEAPTRVRVEFVSDEYSHELPIDGLRLLFLALKERGVDLSQAPVV
jgi:hypothetical protein